MVYQPPSGARDLLPVDVIQKQWIEDRLQQVFDQWGYHRIITSTLERLDTLMAGGAVDRSSVIQIQDMEEEDLGLRPELTASIARAAVTRLAGASYPQRLYYSANVFRRAQQGSYNRQQEFYQAGVELIGGGGVVADSEILLLLVDCLQNLGFEQAPQAAADLAPNWRLILGDAGLTRSLLSVFPETLRGKVRSAIAHLDRLALETLPLSQELRQRALFMLDLRGNPSQVLQKVFTLDLTPKQQESVNNLKSLIEILSERSSNARAQTDRLSYLLLDLSLIQTIDYYTGIVFEVVGQTAAGQRILGQGGRYDQLLGLYHPQGESYPGIGFALNTETLYQVLLPYGHLPAKTPATDWLVVPADPTAAALAFTHADSLRQADVNNRVEIYLEEHPSPEAVQHYANHRRIKQIVWINDQGVSTIETVS